MLQNVTLEMSLKPFKDPAPEAVQAVVTRLFEQWRPLCQQADGVSVMLWTADGSEILDYRGDLDASFEWACWVGGANPRSTHPADPKRLGLHSRCYLYTERPPTFTYRWLRSLVAMLKVTGRTVTGRPTRVGATFDPGPEFAKSSFKYERHNEVCTGGTMGRTSFVCCYAVLHGDEQAYAGFPDGLPDGTSVGTFLGRQAQCFLSDLGFDYIWFSNGFGFGLETWALRGAVFDGKAFSPARCPEVREKILGFWQSFRRECPAFPVETRGTNLSTGMDLSSDAVPLREIYRGGFGVEPPPNSPWAALNGDFGLELVGWMSHIAELPGRTFPFRFYTHDPWWNNSPWLDRYGREPHDIFLPLSVARLDAQARVTPPTSINLLTVDDSWGEMPDIVPREVIPAILNAWETGPDQPGPLVWVYPFDEYHQMTYGEPARIEEVFFGDWFMRGAVNNGLPLNSVISTRNFVAASAANPAAFSESILVSPVPDAGTDWAKALLGLVRSGGRVLLYGPLGYADPAIAHALNLRRAEPLAGPLALALRLDGDLGPDESGPRPLIHPALFSAGGLDGVLADAADPYTAELARASSAAGSRAVVVNRAVPDWNGGRLAWVRGTVACDPAKVSGHLLVPFSLAQSYPGERLMRLALGAFDFDLQVESPGAPGSVRLLESAQPELHCPLTCISRHRNAFYFCGYVPDTTVRLHLRLPQGAPLLLGYETVLTAGRSTYSMPRAWRRECRVFVEQQTGTVGCRRIAVSTSFTQRYGLSVTGLRDATLRLYPVPGTEDKVAMLRNPRWPFIEGEFLTFVARTDHLGRYLEASGVTGEIMITW